MSIIQPLDPDQFDDEVARLGERVREYTRAPGVTNYVRSAAHHPAYLECHADEGHMVMPSGALKRKTKEIIATAVSMTNGCEYCTRAHSKLTRTMFKLEDADLVEIAAVAAHISGLAALEFALQISASGDLCGRWGGRDPADLPALREIESEYGEVPVYFRVLSRRPEILGLVWKRERSVLLEGRLPRVDKHLIAYAVAATRSAPYQVAWQSRRLEVLEVSDDQLLEAGLIADAFNKNNTFTEGLRLEMGLWSS